MDATNFIKLLLDGYGDSVVESFRTMNAVTWNAHTFKLLPCNQGNHVLLWKQEHYEKIFQIYCNAKIGHKNIICER